MEYKLSTYRVFLVFVLLYMSVLSTGIVMIRRPGQANEYAFVGSEVYHGIPDPDTMIQQAHAAHVAMQALPGGNKPSVMTALWTGNGRIYFGSSMAGKTIPDAWTDQHVTDVLHACSVVAGGGHRCNARCGEINALSHWFQTNAGPMPPHGKLIVTVTRQRTNAPCDPKPNEPNMFGCRQVLTRLGFSPHEMIMPENGLEGMEPLQRVLRVKEEMCYISEDKNAM